MTKDLVKPINATEFARRYPEVQGVRANYSNIVVGNLDANGTVTLPTNAGSGTLALNGQIQIQTFAGSAILAVKLGGTVFRFACVGTLP